MGMFNRIYPLGEGEGVNKLTIESVNNGIPYLEDRKPEEEIIATVWPDKRFTDVHSLKSSAKTILDEWKKPKIYWKTTAADVSSLTGLSIDKFKSGAVVRSQLDNYPTTELRIMNESKSDIKGDPSNTKLEIGNVQKDLATTNADSERRQQVNELYSQGATNILNFDYQDNCDSRIPASIPFYVDDDVVNINSVELTFRTKKYRAYSRATKSAGQIVKSVTTGGGGATVKTSTTGGGGSIVKAITTQGGGGVNISTLGGGATTQTSEPGTFIDRLIESSNPSDSPIAEHTHLVTLNGSNFTHSHAVTTKAHTHGLSLELPNHTHPFEFTLDNHTHGLEISIPGHIHEVQHEIIEIDTLPTAIAIKVDGNKITHSQLSGDRINIVDHMSKNSSGKVTRGTHKVEILPNDLARIEAYLTLRVFIQSQLGGVF